MISETLQSTTKTFKYSFPTCTNENVLFKLEVPVTVPHEGSTRELVQRVISMFHIPVYLEDELNEKLAKFVAEETKNFHNDRDEKLINQLKHSEVNVEGVVKQWERWFKDSVVEYAEQRGTCDEEVFAAAYHRLVHSPALDTILQVEDSYAQTVHTTLRSRDEDINKLTQRQTEEMEEKMRLLNTSTTEAEINALAARHFEEQGLAAGRWGSQLDALCQAQRARHRTWLMSLHEHLAHPQALAPGTPSNSPLGTFEPRPPSEAPPPACEPPPPPRTRLEESFTIHLGSQLKQTHNIRILTMDVADLFQRRHDDNAAEWSRRLQRSLGLYSGELCGCVLVSDATHATHAATHATHAAHATQRLAAAARECTEHHFPDIDAQLADIERRVKEPVEKRNLQRIQDQSNSNNSGGNSNSNSSRVRSRRNLQTGDIFITKHSNLAEVHVVFHLLIDDSSSGDITSRHPAILGLRNVLKAACCNDVTSLALPLLLRHDLTEDMTASWCVRRAELVLKCVKGFMLECAGWGGAELRTLTLLVPPALAPALCASLAALLPACFRLASPLKFKAFKAFREP